MTGDTTFPVTGCSLSFDLAQPGLAQTLDCPFEIPAGTYTGAGPVFDATFDVVIDDTFNNIYTDPTSGTKLTTTRPTGGGQPITIPNPRGPGSQVGNQQTRFTSPLVVNAGPVSESR